MLRAEKVFTFEERDHDAPFVERIWRTNSEPLSGFMSIATARWGMVVTRQGDHSTLTVRGPQSRASRSDIPQDATFFGIVFRPGAFMPSLSLDRLVDRELVLTGAGCETFRLQGEAWAMPDYDHADAFVRRLVRQGRLVFDPVVEAALRGERLRSISVRSVQRRVRRATGLTQGAIRQIERATTAAGLLDRGAAILDVVDQAGFADQSHLSRSLRRFMGQSPGRLAKG